MYMQARQPKASNSLSNPDFPFGSLWPVAPGERKFRPGSCRLSQHGYRGAQLHTAGSPFGLEAHSLWTIVLEFP